ncbi:MAG: glycosyltransferase family 4 protein [Lachnospiraceae bacterium]|nr:glycosyltransferase family 4 protein [Lachnospiraceae bacterium]
MKVLWLCNIMLPVIAQALGLPASNKEGWLSGIAGKMVRSAGEPGAPDLSICFPIDPHMARTLQGRQLPSFAAYANGLLVGKACGLRFYGFEENTLMPEVYDAKVEKYLKRIISDVEPDVVHCFGTEYPHTLAMTRAFNRPKRTLIGIQGLCSVYADEFMADLPLSVQWRVTPRDFLRHDSLRQQQKKYRKRGEYEIEALQNAGHVTGRTDWDRYWTHTYNPNAQYHFMNETLRSNFYQHEAKWTYSDTNPYSIFVSQGNYPIKGLHYLLWALPKILEQYPDTHVYVAGDRVTRNDTFVDFLKLSGYGLYLKMFLIMKRMRHAVTFLGKLTAEEMRQQFLSCHVFVSPSSIENSPNSVGEAMLLGVPVISSDVGGVHNMLKDGEEGWLYPKSDTDALAKRILYVFDQANHAKILATGVRASVHAAKTHDPKTNYDRLLEIYREIAGVKETTV